MSRIANINIQPPVVVDICKNDSGTPHAILFKTRFISYVFKLPISFIQIELITAHIRSHENIRKSVVVNISDGHPTPIVKIPEKKAVIQSAVLHIILKMNPRRINQFE